MGVKFFVISVPVLYVFNFNENIVIKQLCEIKLQPSNPQLRAEPELPTDGLLNHFPPLLFVPCSWGNIISYRNSNYDVMKLYAISFILKKTY